MKNDLKRFEIAAAQADCTVAQSRWFVSSWCRGVSGEEAPKRRDTREGGREGMSATPLFLDSGAFQ